MKVSVITVVFNAKETIANAIDSVLCQSHPDVELIVVDGASTDGTREMLELYRRRISILISEPDHGIYDALNKGIAHASGDIIGFLHADDLYENENVIEKIAGYFQDEETSAVYGDLVYVGQSEPDKVIRYWKAGKFSQDKLVQGWMPPHPTLYLRRSIYNEVGVFDLSFHIAADYDFILRVFGDAGYTFQYIPEVLVRMRLGGESNHSAMNIIRKSCEDYRTIKMNHVGGVITLLQKNFRKIPQFFYRETRSRAD